MAEALARLALDLLPIAELSDVDLVVPIPMPTVRRIVRGFNQAELIAEVVGGALGRPVLPALRRPRVAARAQVRLRAFERRSAARNRFVARGEVEGRSVLIVDDVVTTGATFEDGSRALRAAGATSARALALAATPARHWVPMAS